jgi:hypothetical protein
MKPGFMGFLAQLVAWASLAGGAIAAIIAAPDPSAATTSSTALIDCIMAGRPRALCERLLSAPTDAAWTLAAYYAISGLLGAVLFGSLASVVNGLQRLNDRLAPPAPPGKGQT